MIKLFTAADANYYTQVTALIESLNRTQLENFNFTILGTGWTEIKKARLKNEFKNREYIFFEEVDEKNFLGIKLSNGFPLATAYNLIGPKYFFGDLEKIIYLDADTLVLKDLTQVWNLNFQEPVAAVSDSHIAVMGNPSIWRPWREERLNPLTKYLNTGFMIINIRQWNATNTTEKCLHLLQKYKLPCLDQDALNIVINGDYFSLHPQYNLMPMHLMPKLRYSDLIESYEDLSAAIESPAVIHFHRSFFGKPWNFGCTHPNKKLWRNIAKSLDSHWKLRLNLSELARGIVAKLIKLSTPDARIDRLRKLKI
jgi:lipopolysaccharide biosynthesis glycosyltransferase